MAIDAAAEAAPSRKTDASNLSARLRAETSSEHERAEHRSFITQLMGGELTLADYTRYLAQLAYVYEALETRRAQPGDPAIINDARLHRSAAIAADLRALGVTDREEQHPPLASTRAYVALLERAQAAHEYLAHHYTRYLGDLSGGQVIGSKLARLYDATPEQLHFFRFDEIEKPVIYKREYREALDALALSNVQADELIAEAQAAFGANSALFDELASV